MKNLTVAVMMGVLCVGLQRLTAQDFDEDLKWRARFDIGGSIPEDADLTEFVGRVRGVRMKLSPGALFDLSFGYRPSPWLEVGPELGFLFNDVDSFDGFSYPDTYLLQMPIMANVQFEYPYAGRFAPYVGAGIGGVASFLTFGANGGWEPDGSGSDFVLGFQAFAGVRYRFTPNASLGVTYRFLATDEQHWDIEWWDGGHFGVGVESVHMHSFSLVLGMSF